MEPRGGSAPFRSLGEQVREHIRRIEEETTTVVAENARLLAEIRRPRRRRIGSTGLLAIGVATAAAGCGVGVVDADDYASRLAAFHARMHDSSMDDARAAERDCEKRRAEVLAMLTTCRERPWPPETDARKARFGGCQAGDPLCAPTVVAFDRVAAATALTRLEPEAARCLRRNRDIHVHATMTVAFDGSVTAAHLDQPADLGPGETSCVTDKLRGVHLPPFDGAPVTVGRTFRWGAK